MVTVFQVSLGGFRHQLADKPVGLIVGIGSRPIDSLLKARQGCVINLDLTFSDPTFRDGV